MVNFQKKAHYNVEDLRRIMALLRQPDGCPWDRAQTHRSIRPNMLEEAYEAADAIDRGDTENLKEELGDVLLQVVFHARMEEEAGRFDLWIYYLALATTIFSLVMYYITFYKQGYLKKENLKIDEK